MCLSFAGAEQLWLDDKLHVQTLTSSFRTVCSSPVLFTMTPTVVLNSHSSCIFYVLYICWETAVIDGFPAVPIVAQRLTHSRAAFPLSTVPWRESIRLGGKNSPRFATHNPDSFAFHKSHVPSFPAHTIYMKTQDLWKWTAPNIWHYCAYTIHVEWKVLCFLGNRLRF